MPTRLAPLLDYVSEEHKRLLLEYADSRSMRAMERQGKSYGYRTVTDSTISRWLDPVSRTLVDAMNERSLKGLRLVTIEIDATYAGGKARGTRTMLWAYGVTTDGIKIPLRCVEGKTECKRLVKRLYKSLEDGGLNMKYVVRQHDGGLALLHGWPKGVGVVQRCVVHKMRNVVWENLPAKLRKTLGMDVRDRMKEAWQERDLEKAKQLLKDTAQWLSDLGHPEAAASILEGLENTLMLQKLGVKNKAAIALMNQTNGIESVHSWFSTWRRKMKKWSPANEKLREALTEEQLDDRMRFMVMAIACAEENWERLPIARSELEWITLLVFRELHPEVALDLELDGERVRIHRVSAVGNEEAAVLTAMVELTEWADLHQKELHLEPDAFGASLPDVRQALIDQHGFTSVDQLDVITEALARAPLALDDDDVAPHQDPALQPVGRGRLSKTEKAWKELGPPDPWIGRFRGVLGDEQLIGMVEMAIELAPEMAKESMSDEQLEGEAARLDAVLKSLRTVDRRAREWAGKHTDDAGKLLAIDWKPRSGSDPPSLWRSALGTDRSRVLGDELAQKVVGRLSWWRGSIRGYQPAAEVQAAVREKVSDSFAQLDRVVEDVRAAARVLAAGRELERRRQLKEAELDVAAGGGEPGPAGKPGFIWTHATPEIREGVLGARREPLLRAWEVAVVRRAAEGSRATLVALRATLRKPWSAFDAAKGKRIVAGEEVEQEQAVTAWAKALVLEGTQAGRALRCEGNDRASARALASQHRGDAARLWEQQVKPGNDRLSKERRGVGSLDRLLIEHPELMTAAAVERLLTPGKDVGAELGGSKTSEVAVGVG